MSNDDTEDKVEVLDELNSALEREDQHAVSDIVQELHPAQLGHVLESLPPVERLNVFEQAPEEVRGDVLLFVNDEVRSGLIEQMDESSLLAAAENLETDDLADILPDLPGSVISELLQAMDEQDRQRLETILQYPEDTAGGLMNVDTVTVRPDVSLEVVLRYLRYRANLPENTDKLWVVNRQDIYQGFITLGDLVSKDPALTVSDILRSGINPIKVDMRDIDVAHLFEKLDLISAPVVDSEQRLLGRITIDDVVDVLRDEADHTILSRAGLHEDDDMFSPVVRSTQRRSVWLGINLLTALLASWVIGLFDATIEQMVALAVLMPVVASMGGIAGSQTLTLVIRGVALGQVGAFSGAIIPLVLKRFGADPALAGSVVLTTVTDVVGFFIFLGLAAVFLV
jgi:magnesium transporter